VSEKRIKDWFLSQSLDHPKRTTIITLLISILMGSGLQFFKIEDDMMKMIPENIETRRVWEEVKDEFGNTEMIFVAFGERGTSAYNRESMAELWDFTEVVEASPLIEEVISLSNMNRMESVDDFLEVDDLVPSRDLDSGETTELELLEEKDQLAEQVKSQEQSLESLSKDLSSQRVKLEHALAASSSEKKDLEKRREEKTKELSVNILARYKRILSARNGLAVVSLEGRSCGGCGAALPPQLVAEVKTLVTIQNCSICTRFLFWEKPE